MEKAILNDAAHISHRYIFIIINESYRDLNDITSAMYIERAEYRNFENYSVTICNVPSKPPPPIGEILR